MPWELSFPCHTRPGVLPWVSSVPQPRTAVTTGAEGREGSCSCEFRSSQGNRQSRRELTPQNRVRSSQIPALEWSQHCGLEWRQSPPLWQREISLLPSVVILKFKLASKTAQSYLLCKPQALNNVNFFQRLLSPFGLKVGRGRSRRFS